MVIANDGDGNDDDGNHSFSCEREHMESELLMRKKFKETVKTSSSSSS